MKSLHLLDKVDTTLNPSQISGGCIIQEAANISWLESSTNEMWASRCPPLSCSLPLTLVFFLAKKGVNTEQAAGLLRTEGNTSKDVR